MVPRLCCVHALYIGQCALALFHHLVQLVLVVHTVVWYCTRIYLDVLVTADHLARQVGLQ